MSKPYEFSAELQLYKKQYDSLLELSRSPAIDSGDSELAFREIVWTAAATLQCERASIWLYNDSRDAITCVCLYSRKQKEFSFGEILHAADFPAYFQYLNEERFLSASDTYNDPATLEFKNGYLEEHDIRSMLDAPIRLDGNMIGVLCHEHCGEIREWSIVEQSYAGVLSEMVSRAIQAKNREKAQRELKIVNENLERIIHNKTNHLEAALQSSEEKLIRLQQLNRDKNQMMGMVVHDLKNPLTAVTLYADSILMSNPTREQAQYAHLIQDIVTRMTKTIEGFLQSMESDSGRISLRKRPIDMAQLIMLVVSMNEEQAKRKEQSISLELEDGCLANVDEDKMCEVLDNLVSNAIKYSERGKEIRIVVKRVEYPNPKPQFLSSVVVAVSDKGQGFSEDDKHNLFGSFQRLSSTPTAGESASGLGLSIAKQLVELHEGKIWVHSDGKDKGATFYVELPAAEN
ncbi:MAG: GAF domain-containing sensor histidine kinase [Chloroherpetonaceae bacterium]|nr:GAF domain-containing sensor histidine kinase [Chloroherpetonaceae bacterium]